MPKHTRSVRMKTFRSALLTTSLVGLLMLSVPGSSTLAAPTLSFNAFIATSTNSSFNFPAFAAVGDFNGDGKLDSMVTDGSTSLRLMLGDGTGHFSQSNIDAP